MFELKAGKTIIIAEMANAHEGRLEDAKSIVQAAAQAGADAIKFQAFTPDELAVPSHSYYDLYQRLQMPNESWLELVTYASSLGLSTLADVFGLASARQMRSLNIDGFKIHAADIANIELLRDMGNSGKPVLLSTGGSTWIETAEAIACLRNSGSAQIILMHGFQGYPTRLSDSALRRIHVLSAKFGLPVGFAGHVDASLPVATELPMWAAAAGAQILEVHIALDRSKKGLDYFSSLEPEEFAKMVKGVRMMESSLGKESLEMAEDELAYRNRHKKQLVAVRNINAGEQLSDENIALKRIESHQFANPLRKDLAVEHIVLNPIQADAPVYAKYLKIKVAAVLACRLESRRLYGKPMHLVGDRPIIQHLIDRLRKISLLDHIVLAVSEGPGHNVFVEFAGQQHLSHVIGPEKDVLRRLLLAADSIKADVLLRVTTENPYIFWENLDDLIVRHVHNSADLTVTESLPLGAGAEIISLQALKNAHTHGEDRHRSELCSLFIAENPDIFSIQRIPAPEKLRHPEMRLTVDTPHDLILVRTLWQALHKENHLIAMEEIVQFLLDHPEIAAINSQENSLHLWK